MIASAIAAVARLPLTRNFALGCALILAATAIAFGTWTTERKLVAKHAREIDLTAAVARAEAAGKAKSTFLANMSHELRTPLNSVIGFAQELKDEHLGPLGTAQYKEYARDIAQSGQHLLGIINDILELVRLDAGMLTFAREPVDLADVAAELVEGKQNAAEQAGVGLTLAATKGIATVSSDHAALSKVVSRLLSNAIKYTPKGGMVTLSVMRDAAGRGWTITVADTGVGIDPADIPAALAAFSQVDASLARRREGLGVGLSLTRETARALGAEFALESRPGAGTRVSLTLPRIAPATDLRKAA